MTLPRPLLRVAALARERLAPLAAPRTVELLDRTAALEDALAASVPALGETLFEAAGPPDPEAGVEAARARLAVVALRRAVFNRRLPAASDVRRAGPRLGPDLHRRLESWMAQQREILTLHRRRKAVFESELREARQALVATAREPDFQAAIRLVSGSLLASLRSLGDPAGWRHDERLLANRLAAYVGRAATKTSPNGLFCATALAAWTRGPANVAGENRLRLDVLLNVTEARKVAACLGAEPESRPALVPRINPTLHQEEDGGWTFWRPASLRRLDDKEVHRRLQRQPIAEVFLRHAEPGELAVPRLLAAVARETGVELEDLAGFFERLADAGMLSAEIEIPYTCRRPLAFLAAAVRRAGGRPGWLGEVEAVERRVERLADLPPLDRIAAMDEVTQRLEALPHNRRLAADELFRVDAASALRVDLPADLLTGVADAVSRYARLFAGLYPRSVLRRNLARPFLRRYGPDQEVSLLDLYHRLDIRDKTEGRPTAFPAPPAADGEGAGSAYERARSFFVERAREAAEAGVDEVSLGEADWQILAGGEAEPAWEAGVLFQVAARDARALAAGRYRVVLNDLFTGVGVALARFAHLHAPDDPSSPNPIVQELRRSLDRFVPPGVLPAEVTFNHWGRAANAGLRLPFLEHEIELLGERASAGATVIPLAELTLRWASDEERLVLRWPRRGVEVLPVLSSGVATEGFISLLAGIGRQSIQPLSLFPGFEAEGVTCWPRFVHGPVVIFRRRWIFPPGEAPEPPGAGAPDRRLAEFFGRVHRWRRQRGLPCHLFVSSSRERKPFYVDLSSPLFAGLLQRLLTPPPEEPPATLYATETLPGPEELWVRDSAGRYASELLVQMGSGL